MFLSQALLSSILVSLTAVDANPLSRSTGKATLGFVTRINHDGMLNIADKDRGRAQVFKNNDQHLGKRSTPFSITNGVVTYTALVGIGSPPTNYTLLIDTGSSNTWVGASQSYTQTSTSTDTGNAISVSYGSGDFEGEEWTDTITLAPDLVIRGQSIGVASSSDGFDGIDGILGVGPVDLTSNTVSNTATVPTILDNLLSQGTISEETLGICFVPVSEPTSTGTLTFGGYDSSAVSGPVNYVPFTQTSPASEYWGIDQSVSYGGNTILSSTAGIVDTGTTLILIATNAFQAYQSATGGIMDSINTGLLTISSTQYASLGTLSFNIGGQVYDLSPNAQIWPRSLNTAIGGSSSMIYLVVGDIGNDSGSGLDFINGYAFLERYYSVFDASNKQIGFAATPYTEADTN